jgi:hypothetical protein
MKYAASGIDVRTAREADFAEMLDHNAIGHPADKHPRSIAPMREAFSRSTRHLRAGARKILT